MGAFFINKTFSEAKQIYEAPNDVSQVKGGGHIVRILEIHAKAKLVIRKWALKIIIYLKMYQFMSFLGYLNHVSFSCLLTMLLYFH